MAVAEAMKPEHDAIHAAGFVLQLDCPDLAGGYNRPVAQEMSLAWVKLEALVEGARLASQRLWA